MSLPADPRPNRRGPNPYGASVPSAGYYHTAYDVAYAMRHANAPMRFAILKSYGDGKLSRGKTKSELNSKLTILEEDLRWRSPDLARSFDEIRDFYLLGPSRLSSRQPNYFVPAQTLQQNRPPPVPPVWRAGMSRANTRASVAASVAASSRPTVTRAPEEPGDELPPPPYSSRDPEPEATAVLMEIQRAESRGQGDGLIASMTTHRRASSDVGTTSSLRRASSSATSRPTSIPATPAQRAASLHGLNGAAGSTSNGSPARPTTPLDAQEQRIREESELEEAMRLSRQSEKERLEYERAVQASIATYEEDRSLRSIQQERYPGEDGAGSSSQAGGGGSAPALAYFTPSGGSVSHMNGNGALPGNGGPSASERAATPVDLMDQMDNLNFYAAPPLTPSPAATSATAVTTPPPVAPQWTGLQSNNPFLSEVERAAQSTPGTLPETGTGRALPPLPHDAEEPEPQPQQPYAAPGQERLRQEGTQRVSLPPLPHEQPAVSQYAPPHGPPPGWVPEHEHEHEHEHEYDGHEHPPMPPEPARHGYYPSDEFRLSPPVEESTYRSPPPTMTAPLGLHSAPGVPATGATSLRASPALVPRVVSPASTNRTTSPAPILIGGENALEMLREYDTVFLIDDSTSMKGERWQQAITALMGVVEQAVQYDEDGVDIYFLNSKRVGKGLRTAEDVEELFAGLEPKGATPTGLRMESILRDYMARLERATAAAANGDGESVRAMNLIVITDGAPTDDPESVLISIAKRLDRGDYPLSQVGVQLLQIGDDPEATEALQELDDGLSRAHGVRDMVDTVPYSGEALSADLIVKVLLGGINLRIDRKFNGRGRGA